MPQTKRFIFNDESIANTYGFYILTEGIDLTRFTKNPVMLSDHWNSNRNVIGRWTDFKKEGTTLTGLPEFDTEDADSNVIAGKVERGFINACSMGIIVDRENLNYIEGKIFLTKCELAEVSIVPVPSNANAVRLMNQEGDQLSEEEIKTLCLSVVTGNNPEEINLKITNMKKIILSVPALMALGLNDQPTDGTDASVVEQKLIELSGKVTKLTKDNEDLKLAAKTAEDNLKAQAKASATTQVELAISQGKIAADKKDQFIELGVSNPEVLVATLAAIPAKNSLGLGVTQPTGNGGIEVKTAEDFQKLSSEEQLSFKNDNPEAYKKLFAN